MKEKSGTYRSILGSLPNIFLKKLYMGVILRAHHVRNETHIQRNTNQEVATSLWALSCL